jgi:hypothetical protein
VKQPVDFYSRPLWKAAIDDAGVSLSLSSISNQVLLENAIVIPDLAFAAIFSARYC